MALTLVDVKRAFAWLDRSGHGYLTPADLLHAFHTTDTYIQSKRVTEEEVLEFSRMISGSEEPRITVQVRGRCALCSCGAGASRA